MKQNRTRFFIFTCILIGLGFTVNAQENPKKLKRESDDFIVEAQEALSENDFASAEASYRKAISKDPSNLNARYNMGNLYYGKEKSVNAEQRLKEAAEIAATKEEKHRIYHNLGNSYMQQEKYQEAVDAYKDALRNDPTDDETRYNLALAKRKLEKEGQGQDQNQDQNSQDQNKEDQNQDQQQKDQQQDGGGDDQNQDQKPNDEGENEKDKKEGDQNEDKEKDKGDEQQKDQDEGDKEKQQQQRPAQGQLSPQQIKSLLEAMNNEEKKVQDKINAEKAKGVKVKSEKDW
ncbi:tetratricopeptide repeat protein [Gramella sp. KN1008]|uniref:tetratricopeptide repeat protein n=1 Tax=Gramella sp. KN1008 TaxID=2529298 RepID=UPI00103B6365|nr:tetratricopeptide repeat protein [Gramella sp. KN1008]TBW27058.1 tetratricopeptide repeat protein [Gramella sp. KN1008]